MHTGGDFLRKNSHVNDLCKLNLIKCIKCDVPCSEGYGPGNLVTTNFIERSKGFLAERFIKPPVMVTLEFECEVDINYVAIVCCVGAQKTKGIEIFTKFISDETQFESVASGVLPEDKQGFVFHKFDCNVKDRFGEKFCFRTFKSSRFLSRLKSFRIKIFRTCGMSIPALGKVEIWGSPCKNVTFPVNKTLKLQDVGLNNKVGEDCAKSCTTPTTDSKSLKKLTVVDHAKFDDNTSIPDDFIDPITCNIMIQPVILPSGKVIDISTLESYEKAEKTWGRGPSDPFTGVPFSSCYKPIAATDLKSRIDKFLSINCNIEGLKSVPRTLGRRNPFLTIKKLNSEINVSKLITKSDSNSSVKSISITESFSEPKVGSDELNLNSKLKRGNSVVDLSSVCSKQIFTTNTCTSTKQVMPSSSTVFSLGTSNNKRGTAVALGSFQERMEKSLESSLRSTLSKLPRFADKVDSTETFKDALCNTCRSITNLFSIPCNHFVCRLCLLDINKNIKPAFCGLCYLEYKTSQVQKVHTKLN